MSEGVKEKLVSQREMKSIGRAETWPFHLSMPLRLRNGSLNVMLGTSCLRALGIQ